MRGPRHNIHRSGVEGEVGDLLPLSTLFAPDEDLAVIAGGSEDVAVLRVGLVAGRGQVLGAGIEWQENRGYGREKRRGGGRGADP